MSAPKLQRRTPQSDDAVSSTRDGESAFSQHAQEEEERRIANDIQRTGKDKALSLLGRILLFMGVPSLMGCMGLLIGYLTRKRTSLEGDAQEIDFDRDFVFPFLLSLVMVIVIGIQTKGFSKSEATPILAWPKVRRKRRVVHKRVIIDDDSGSPEKAGNVAEVAKEDVAALKAWKKRKGARKED